MGRKKKTPLTSEPTIVPPVQATDDTPMDITNDMPVCVDPPLETPTVEIIQTPESVIPEPVIPEPVIPEPVIPEPVIPEPVIPEKKVQVEPPKVIVLNKKRKRVHIEPEGFVSKKTFIE